MKACIIAVGTEMLTPFRVDTNSLFVTERLNEIGVDVRLKVVAGDDVEEVAQLFRHALSWADVIVATGGLGPTEDDVTRDALAMALGVPLDVDEAIVERIRTRFSRRGMTMPEINRRQAMVPRGAVVLANPNGTAPGLWIERGRSAVVLLPGPPREMKPMFELVTRERLSLRSGRAGLYRRVLRITGRTESDVDTQAQPVYGRWMSQPVPISTTILAVLGQIELHLTARAGNQAEAEHALDSAAQQLRAVLGDSIYSDDGRQLEVVVGDLLRSKGMRIAVAESCTGGLLSSRLTDVPGSSEYVDRGAVCYSNQAKVGMLGVSETLIAEHGAVSEPVARAMADGIQARSNATVAIGVTGIAGPGGGTPEKPVGTVAIAVLVGSVTRVRTFQFVGAREQIKFQAAQAALNMLRLMLTAGD
jgi:competence/damage-inducible protein CinA-like protein